MAFLQGQPGGWDALQSILGLGVPTSGTDMDPGQFSPAVQPSFGPGYGPQQPYGPQVPPGGLPSLGDSLAPGPAVLNNSVQEGGSPTGPVTQAGAESPQTAMARVAGQASGGTQNALASALRGITSPGRPDVVKPTTPHIYRPEKIQSGHLFQLLEQLGNYRQPLVPNRYQTLGQDLAGGR